MPSRGAALKCINGHKLTASWTVPVGVKRSTGARAVQAVKTECPLCGNKLDVFIDGRATPRSFRIRTT
jgi:hypothetical protein